MASQLVRAPAGLPLGPGSLEVSSSAWGLIGCLEMRGSPKGVGFWTTS